MIALNFRIWYIWPNGNVTFARYDIQPVGTTDLHTAIEATNTNLMAFLTNRSCHYPFAVYSDPAFTLIDKLVCLTVMQIQKCDYNSVHPVFSPRPLCEPGQKQAKYSLGLHVCKHTSYCVRNILYIP